MVYDSFQDPPWRRQPIEQQLCAVTAKREFAKRQNKKHQNYRRQFVAAVNQELCQLKLQLVQASRQSARLKELREHVKSIEVRITAGFIWTGDTAVQQKHALLCRCQELRLGYRPVCL